MVTISDFEIKEDKKILFTFSDLSKKLIDFTPFIEDDPLSSLLSNQSFFEKAKLYENGRGIYWPNEFDFCPDFLYSYDEKNILKSST